jgi:iron complex transport system substrate-binding protein
MLLVTLFVLSSPIQSTTKPPAAVRRLVSVSPTLTEIVCDIGACDRLVGVTRFCDVPEHVKALPKIGGFVDPSIEATLALKPDLVVLTTNGANKSFTEMLDRTRVPWIAFRDDALSDYEVIATALGESLGLSVRDKVEAFQNDLARLSVRLPLEQSIVVVYGHAPLVVAGPGTFGAELITRIGATNAYTGERKYPSLDFETLVRAKPAVIVDVDMRGDGRSEPEYYAPVRSMMKSTRFVFSPDPALLRLGPRLPRAMLALRDKIEKERAKP